MVKIKSIKSGKAIKKSKKFVKEKKPIVKIEPKPIKRISIKEQLKKPDALESIKEKSKTQLKPKKIKPKIKPEQIKSIKPEQKTKPITNIPSKKPIIDIGKLPKKQLIKPKKLIQNKSTQNKSTKSIKEEIKKEINNKPKNQGIEQGPGKPGEKQELKQGILETYEIEVDKAKVRVEIKRETSIVTYNIYVPIVGIATASLLGEIRNELVTATTVSMREITDPAVFNVIKKKFMEEASTLLISKLPSIQPPIKEFLVGKLMQDMLGLGEIEFLINDPYLEEIVIPSSKEFIRVYHKRYGWLLTNLKIAKEDEIINYSNIIARRVGRQITVLTPLLDAHLVTGDRVNAILYPINTKGNTITIRKFARDPYTIVDLINNKTCNVEVAILLWLAIEYEMNVLISGGTASGKTVLLNACMSFIPPNHRIISVEDTRELMLPDFLYWTPLVTRIANPEGKGEVSMLDLLVNSLRMRPDRIVLGEMRRKEEAMVLFEAMHTGHSVYATVHADSAAETISRLINPPLKVPPNLLKAVNLNVVMFRDRKRGLRRVLHIAEFEASKNRAEAVMLYRWIPEQDKIIKHSEHSRFLETVNKNTGMSQAELSANLETKKQILLWMIKNKIRDLNDFGRIMSLYYRDKERLINFIKKNDVKNALGR